MEGCPDQPAWTRAGTTRSNYSGSRTRVLTPKTWCRRVSFESLPLKLVKLDLPEDHKILPFFFQILTTFSLKSVDFWHNTHRIWPDRWFLIKIWQKSRQIQWDLIRSWMDLARSHRIWTLVNIRFTRNRRPPFGDPNRWTRYCNRSVASWK